MVTGSAKSSKHVFYAQLARLLSEGGFDRHIGALCKPFISDESGPNWWSAQPSSYFRILFVGFLEGVESEQELCWHIEDSRSFREFVGFDENVSAPDPGALAQIRQRLMPLIHSEAFDAFMRIIDKTGILDGRVPGLEATILTSDPGIAAVTQRIRDRDHHNYWKRLTKTAGAGRLPRSSFPPANRPTSRRESGKGGAGDRESEPFAIWVEDLSLAQAAIAELRTRGIIDFKAYFDQNESPAVEHVTRACIYGRGPASVQAFLGSFESAAGRELPQQLTAESTAACRAIAVALAEGKRQLGIEVPLLDAEGKPAIASIQLAVQPGFEETLGSVLVAFTDITARKRLQAMPARSDSHIEKALRLNQVGVWEWDINTDATQWSDAMYSIYGITREEFTGRHADYADLTYPDDRELQRESVRQSFADFAKASQSMQPHSDSSTSFKDFRIRRKDGQIRWVRGGAVEVVDDQGRPIKMQGVLWDITEGKLSELALVESESRYRRMVQNASLSVVVAAFDGEIIFANDCALAFFGVARDELPKMRSINFWEDPAQSIHAASVLAEVGELRNFEARYLVGAEREPKSVLLSASVVEYGGRNVILTWHQELPAQKVSEALLRSMEQQVAEQLQSVQAQSQEQLQALRQQAEAQLLALQLQAEQQVQLARQQAEDMIEARNRELSLMHQVMGASHQETANMLAVACQELGQALGWPMAIAGILSEDRTELRLVAEYLTAPHRSCVGMRIAMLEGGVLDTFAENLHPMWIEDASADERIGTFRDLLVAEPNASLLVLPLVSGESLAGLLLLGTHAGSELNADAMSLASNVGGQVGRSLAFTRLVENHERLRLAFERVREIVVVTDAGARNP